MAFLPERSQVSLNAEAGASGRFVEGLQPRPRPSLKRRPVPADEEAHRRARGEVGHRVEGGVGVPADFLSVVGIEGGNVGVELFDRFIGPLAEFLAGNWQGKHGADDFEALRVGQGDAAEGTEAGGEPLFEITEIPNRPGKVEFLDGVLRVGGGDGRHLLFEDHAVGAVLPHETEIEAQRAPAVVAVGHAEERRVDIGNAAGIAQQVHDVRPVLEVERDPAPVLRPGRVREFPLAGRRIWEDLSEADPKIRPG